MADVNGGKMNGFVAAGREELCKPSGPCHADVMGYHVRHRHPQLLGVRQQLRAAGPHVRGGPLVEPAVPPVRGLRMVGQVHPPGRPDELHRAPTSRQSGPRPTRRRSPGPT